MMHAAHLQKPLHRIRIWDKVRLEMGPASEGHDFDAHGLLQFLAHLLRGETPDLSVFLLLRSFRRSSGLVRRAASPTPDCPLAAVFLPRSPGPFTRCGISKATSSRI